MAVKASGLNFRDVMTALGQIAQYPLGIECAGVITSIGRGVRPVSVGDHVIVSQSWTCFLFFHHVYEPVCLGKEC